MHCLRLGKKPAFVLEPLKATINPVFDIISLQQLEYEMERADLFEIGYCSHPAFHYAHIKLEQATKLIISHFQ